MLAERDASTAKTDASFDVDEPDSAALDGTADGADGLDVGQDAVSDTLQPDGPPALTLVHGIVDATALRVCFSVQEGAGFAPMADGPFPKDSQGLAYAHAMRGPDFSGYDLAKVAIRPVVLTGDLTQTEGLSCALLSSPPEGVVLSPLSVLPAGTLTRGRSLLLVFAGCVGGKEHGQADALSQRICGEGYAPTHPTLSMLASSMDRIGYPDAVGMQAFGGSLASPPLAVSVLVGNFAAPIDDKIGVGVLAPRPAASSFAAKLLDPSLSTTVLRIRESNSLSSNDFVIGEALTRGGLTPSDLVDGQNYTAVMLGPAPSVASGAWWNGFAVAVVRNAP